MTKKRPSRSLCLLALITLVCGCSTHRGFPRESITIDHRVVPNSRAKTTQKTVRLAETRIDAEASVVERLEAKGVKYPIVFRMDETMISTIRYGDRRADGKIPMTWSIDSLDVTVEGNTEIESPNARLRGATVRGLSDDKGNLTDLELESEKLSSEETRAILGVIQALLKNEIDAGQKLTVGESLPVKFKLELPLDSGPPFETFVDQVHTLDAIVAGVAVIRVAHSEEMTYEASDGSLAVRTSSQGTRLYSIEEQRLLEWQTSATSTWSIWEAHRDLTTVETTNTSTTIELFID